MDTVPRPECRVHSSFEAWHRGHNARGGQRCRPHRTQPWTSSFNLRWTPGIELFEYQCQGNNFFPDSVFGANYFEETMSVVP